MDLTTLEKGLALTLDATSLDFLGSKYQGKVRDNYTTRDGRRFIVVTDRISAFDRVLGTLPFKGQVLNSLAAFWFEQTKDIVPNHMLGMPDPNVMECVECEPLKVEMIVRAYLTGVSSTSILTAYRKGERVFCGNKLPDGLEEHGPLPKPILTPTTKAPIGEHDENASREEILERKLVTPEHFDAAAD
jgi:phosphoribosylaminoimidazole-succinocarboxamide synthase